MASTFDRGKSETFFNFPVASGGTVDVPGLPVLSSRSLKIVKAFLGHSKRDSGNVNIPRVNKDVQVGAFFEEVFIEWEHRREVSGVVDLVGTGSPCDRPRVDSLLDLRIIQIVREQSVDGSAVLRVGRVLDGEVESSITGAKVLVEIIRVDAGKRERWKSSRGNFLIKETDFVESGIVDLETGKLEIVGVASMFSPAGVV